MNDEAPKLHIDSDWKAQAQAEKDRLAEKEAARAAQAPTGELGEGELPPADFRALVATLASQAMMGLGAYGDPQTGRVVLDVVGAQFAIDLLGVIEEKTKGNLTAEEAAELTDVLAQLRARFVQIAKLVAAQMQREMAAGMGGGGMGGGMGSAHSGIAGSIGGGSMSAGSMSTGSSATKSGLILPD